jgi:hypothetical protein
MYLVNLSTGLAALENSVDNIDINKVWETIYENITIL